MARVVLLLAALALASAAPDGPEDDGGKALEKARKELDNLLTQERAMQVEVAELKGKDMQETQVTELAAMESDGLKQEETFANVEVSDAEKKLSHRKAKGGLSEKALASKEDAVDAQNRLVKEEDEVKAANEEVEAAKDLLKKKAEAFKNRQTETKRKQKALDLAKMKVFSQNKQMEDAKNELYNLTENYSHEEPHAEATVVEWKELKSAREDRIAHDKMLSDSITAAQEELKKDQEEMKKVENESIAEAEEAAAALAKEKIVLKAKEDEVLLKSPMAAELETAKTKLEKKQKEIAANLGEKEAEYQKKRKELEDDWKHNLDASLSDLQDEIMDKQDELDHLRATNKVESEAVQRKFDALNAELHALEKLRDEAAKDAGKKEETLRASSKRLLENDKLALDKLEGQRQQLVATLKDQTEKLGRLTLELDDLKHELQEATEKKQRIEDREKEQFDKRLHEVKAADTADYQQESAVLKDLQGRYDMIHSNKERSVSSLSNQLKELRAKNAQLRGHVSMMQD